MIEIWAESARLNTWSQRLADQARMILKKDCFSDLEILEIHQQVNREEYEKDLITQTGMLNAEKQELPNRIETQNNEKRITIHPNTTK